MWRINTGTRTATSLSCFTRRRFTLLASGQRAPRIRSPAEVTAVFEYPRRYPLDWLMAPCQPRGNVRRSRDPTVVEGARVVLMRSQRMGIPIHGSPQASPGTTTGSHAEPPEPADVAAAGVAPSRRAARRRRWGTPADQRRHRAPAPRQVSPRRGGAGHPMLAARLHPGRRDGPHAGRSVPSRSIAPTGPRPIERPLTAGTRTPAESRRWEFGAEAAGVA